MKGDLAKPIFLSLRKDSRHPNARPGNERGDTVIATFNAEFNKRLGLLLEHYKIPRDTPDVWFHLAIRLLLFHVPEFSNFQEPPGAPKRWTPERLALLRREVEELTDGGLGAMEACRRLLKNPDGTMRYQGCNAVSTLYRRYQESKAVAPQ
ncbi:MAG: hypothetical protein NTV11_20470 [Rhodocyclales bacterium]|nr:hypothetical protein [Rhodocyclales bacterium]